MPSEQRNRGPLFRRRLFQAECCHCGQIESDAECTLRVCRAGRRTGSLSERYPIRTSTQEHRAVVIMKRSHWSAFQRLSGRVLRKRELDERLQQRSWPRMVSINNKNNRRRSPPRRKASRAPGSNVPTVSGCLKLVVVAEGRGFSFGFCGDYRRCDRPLPCIPQSGCVDG